MTALRALLARRRPHRKTTTWQCVRCVDTRRRLTGWQQVRVAAGCAPTCPYCGGLVFDVTPGGTP